MYDYYEVRKRTKRGSTYITSYRTWNEAVRKCNILNKKSNEFYYHVPVKIINKN